MMPVSSGMRFDTENSRCIPAERMTPEKPPPTRRRTTNPRSTWITRMEVRIDAEIFR